MKSTARVTSKGQIVIPADIRERYGICQGTTVTFIEEGDVLIMQPITEQLIRRTKGISKGGPSLVKMLKEFRKAEDW